MNINYMNFGKLRKAYDSGRHGYPTEVMGYIFFLVGKSSKLLDVGCGTGIATRQLAQKVKDISGCDVDEKMIKTAQDYKDAINYYTAPANKMPFDNEAFDVITSFGAFHWFCDGKSVAGIKRVLKNGGFFIVVNKNETNGFIENFEKIVEKITGTKSPQSVKVGYNPATTLLQKGFSNVTTKKFPHIEEFTIQRAIKQIQSLSLWNFIPENKKEETLDVLRSHFEKSAKDGIVLRQLEIVVVNGTKQ